METMVGSEAASTQSGASRHRRNPPVDRGRFYPFNRGEITTDHDEPNRWRRARRRMIRRDLQSREISDTRVLASMNWVPRERFVPYALRPSAYADIPLPVGHGQTISQPFIVAWMSQMARLTRRSRVLEVGTGTGYHTAVLAKIARHVWSIERIESLSDDAAARLERLGIDNVTLVVGDGAYGCRVAAPFDAVVVAAAAPEAPKPLVEQLADGGRLVIPLGDYAMQDLTVIERQGNRFNRQIVGPCRFVPFVSDLIDQPPSA